MNLELKLTATIGFILVLRADKRGQNDLRHLEMPDEFVNIVRKPGQVTCMTLDLVRPGVRRHTLLWICAS